MHIHNLSEDHSILNSFISEIRDVQIQKDRLRFRRNIERIGEVLCYEMSKHLKFYPNTTTTPLGTSTAKRITNDIVVCSILRAGLPLHNGILNYFDKAENGFISAYRQHKNKSENFEIIVEYLACPNLDNKTLILADPMLATGQSMVAAFDALKAFGTPKHIHLISVIGAQDGVDFVNNHFSKDTHLWIAAVDSLLNDKGYIVPGIGDAGDLAFGEKRQY